LVIASNDPVGDVQLDREAKARRELARASGIALIGISSALEEGLGVTHDAGAATFALVAFAARARRLLRSAYRLIDGGERDAAVPLYRVMNEYLIVGRWLLNVGEEELKLWALNDMRGRLAVLRDVIADNSLDEETKATLGDEVARTEEAIRGYGGDDEPVTKSAARKAGFKVTSLEEMARTAGLDFVYAYPYRLASQTDVHATPTAIDSAYDPDEHGQVVRPVARFALEGYDSYLIGAHLLLDILVPLAERIPELGWGRTTAMVAEVLATVGRADPS
jgi:hypothetical protein